MLIDGTYNMYELVASGKCTFCTICGSRESRAEALRVKTAGSRATSNAKYVSVREMDGWGYVAFSHQYRTVTPG